MTSGDALLRLHNVSKAYGIGPGGGPLSVLNAVSLDIDAGDSVAIVGPSGSGKSTLLHLMAALDRPSSGRVILGGRELQSLTDTEMARVRNRDIGLVFQFHHLLPQCTVVENVLIPTLAGQGGIVGVRALDRARGLLEQLGLGDRFDHMPGQLSGGECQRVAVARALINEPRVLLADEPTGALDRQSSNVLGDLLVELNRDRGVTLVVVTHSVQLAARMARQLELRDGRLDAPSAERSDRGCDRAPPIKPGAGV